MHANMTNIGWALFSGGIRETSPHLTIFDYDRYAVIAIWTSLQSLFTFLLRILMICCLKKFMFDRYFYLLFNPIDIRLNLEPLATTKCDWMGFLLTRFSTHNYFSYSQIRLSCNCLN